jgi:hypothetical protein
VIADRIARLFGHALALCAAPLAWAMHRWDRSLYHGNWREEG